MDLVNYVKSSVDLFFQKKKSYEYIDKKVNLSEALLAVLIIYIINLGLSLLIENGGSFDISLLSTIIYSLIGMGIGLFIVYGIWYMFFKMFGGKSDFKSTLKFGISVGIFSMIVSLILNALFILIFGNLNAETFTYNATNILLLSFYMLLLFIIFIWTFVVLIQTFSRLHKITSGKTFLALIMPLIIMFVLGLLIGLYLLF